MGYPPELYAPAESVGQPTIRPTDRQIELYGERQPAVWVPSAEDPRVMVPVLKQYVQPMLPAQPRDLTPQPLFDPIAQRLVGAGVGGGALAAGVGYGIGQIFTGIAGVTSGGLFWLAVLVLAWKLPSAARASGGDTYNTTYVQQKWLGRTNIHN